MSELRVSFHSALLFLSLLIFTFIIGLPAQSQGHVTTCGLFSGDKLLEKSECIVTTLNSSQGEGEGGTMINYQWANGRVIVTQNIEEFFTINGKEGITAFTKDGFDLCIKNMSDQTTFCTSSDTRAQSQTTTSKEPDENTPKHSIRIDSKYANWVEWRYCDQLGLRPQEECKELLWECENSGEGNKDFSCPDLGVCTYKANGDLKSKGYCYVYRTLSSRLNHAVFQWQNGNNVIIEERENNFTMNDIVVELDELDEDICFYTKNRLEEFCFRQKEDYRFKDGLADLTKAGGVWVTQETICTNRLYPLKGSIGVFENSFYNSKPSLHYWYDDIYQTELVGMEGDACHIYDLEKTGNRSFKGKSFCRGEGIEDSLLSGEDRRFSPIELQIKEDEELLIIRNGRQERYVQCQG